MDRPLGEYVRGFGKIPAGADANVLYSLFQAGEKPVWITHLSAWGGDPSETTTIYLIPPDFVGQASNGQVGPQEVGGEEKNAMAVYGAIEGGAYTSTDKQPVFGQNARAPCYILVPPNNGLAMAASASPSAGFKIVLGGFEIE